MELPPPHVADFQEYLLFARVQHHFEAMKHKTTIFIYLIKLITQFIEGE